MNGAQACHRCLAVRDADDLGAVRRAVAELAAGSAGAGSRADRVAAELARNLVDRPGGGFVLARPLTEAGAVELLAVAQEVNARPLTFSPESAGHSPSSGGGAGLAGSCDVWSCSSRGTAVLIRVGTEPAPSTSGLRAGGVSIAAVDGQRCGDAWAVAEEERFVSVFIVDGLGHGAGAEPAATAAVGAFLEEPAAHPEDALRRVHEAMRGTRGGVAAVCRIDAAGECAVFAGIGNITARLVAGRRSRALVSGHGSLGTQLAFHRPRVETVPWNAAAALVFASDGLRSNIELDARMDVRACHPALSAAVLLRDLRKGNDDATAVVVRDDRCGTS